MKTTVRGFTDVENTKTIIRKSRIAEEHQFAFKAAVIILWAIENQTWNLKRISHFTGYDLKDVYTVAGNLRENGYLETDNNLDLESDSILEFTLLTLVASGEIVRVKINED